MQETDCGDAPQDPVTMTIGLPGGNHKGVPETTVSTGPPPLRHYTSPDCFPLPTTFVLSIMRAGNLFMPVACDAGVSSAACLARQLGDRSQ